MFSLDLKFVVQDDKYVNIRDLLRNEFKVSSRLFLKLKRNKKIFINGEIFKMNSPLHFGDIIEVSIGFDEESENIFSNKMELDIIYEDNYLLILNKPAFVAVHPSIRHFDDSLSNRR